jgi:hypothetical protein
MNVIVEPLSEQAWARVETSLMDRLANDPINESRAQRPDTFRLRNVVRRLVLARRFASWIKLRADQAAGMDAPPQSGVCQQEEPLSRSRAFPLR